MRGPGAAEGCRLWLVTMAVVWMVCMGNTLAACTPLTTPPYQQHETAIADFRRALENDGNCARLCQNASAACDSSRVLCAKANEQACQIAQRGCAWVRTQLPARCGPCAGGDDDRPE